MVPARSLVTLLLLGLVANSASAARDGSTFDKGSLIEKPKATVAAPLPIREGNGSRAATPLFDGFTVSDLVRSELQQSGWVYYYFHVPSGATSLSVDLFSLSGDADLYVRRFAEPSLGAYDCRSDATGNTSESCVSASPAEGLYWVGVNAYDITTVAFDLRASWTCPSGVCDAFPLENGVTVAGTIDGASQQAAWNDYYVGLLTGGSVLHVDLENLTGDADLYMRRMGFPDLAIFDCRSIATGNAAESCTVAIPSSGLWWVSVNNYDVGPIDYDLTATWLGKLADGSVVHDTVQSTTPQAGWVDAFLDVPPGALSLDVQLYDLTGDADLYLRSQDLPDTATFDCASAQAGNVFERCVVNNPPPGRYFVSVNNFDVGRINYTLDAIVDCSAGCAQREGIVMGLGAGPNSPPRSAWVEYDVVTGSFASGITPFDHYGTLQAGVNVDGANLDGLGLGETLTGPGNQAVFGPHVRGWRLLGMPLANLSFYAYGTLRYGVKVRGLQGDGDVYDEIITGAGQGSVFGPHVRGWSYDGGPIAATPVNFFAYSGVSYGVNIADVDLEGGGADELLTAPVFGAGYPTRVRGWDVDITTQVQAIPGLDFLAFDDPDDRGAGVAGGDVDGDGFAEILATRGPVAGLPATVRGFTWDGTTVFLAPELDHTPFTTSYGANVVTADVDADGNEEIVSAPGPDPTALPVLAARDWTGALVPIAGLDGIDPFAVDAPNAREGATLGSGVR